jgi:2'-5' RNA ligase
MRLFFASWPPPAVAQALARWARDAQRECGGRATREEAIHLTFAFLGEAEAKAASALARGVAAGQTSLPIEEAGYWPHNRIVWIGPRQAPADLAALARALGEKRKFAAHVTLLRKAHAPTALRALPELDWPVREFLLVNSRLGPEGPSYEVLERFALS